MSTSREDGMARRRQPGQPSRSNRRRPVSEASRAATPGVAAPQPVSSSRRCLSGRSRRRTQSASVGSDVTTTDARHLDATRPDVRDDQIRLARAGPAGRGGRQRLLHRAHSSANRTTHRGDQQVALPRSSGRRHPHEHRIHGVRRERQVRGQQPQQVYASEVVAHDAVTHRPGRGGATGPCGQRGPPSDLPAVASPAQHRQFADHRAGPRFPGRTVDVPRSTARHCRPVRTCVPALPALPAKGGDGCGRGVVTTEPQC